jgi:hypothetical protein
MTRPTRFDISPKAKVYPFPGSLARTDVPPCHDAARFRPSPDTGARKSGTYEADYHAGKTTGLIFGIWIGAMATVLFAFCWTFVR